MSVSRTIPLDLPCAVCDYNLRGLALDGRCPECGTAVSEIFAAIRAGNRPDLSWQMARLMRLWVDGVARHAGVQRDAVLFLMDALSASALVVTPETERPVAGGRRHITAKDSCARVHEYAVFYFNDADEARDLLGQWGIRASEDVGRVIFGMVEMKMLEASPDDSLGDFDGLFRLETLFGPEDDFSRRGLVRRSEGPRPRMLLSRRPVFSFFCLGSLACAMIVAILWVRSYTVGDTWVRMEEGRARSVISSRGVLAHEWRERLVPFAPDTTPWSHVPNTGERTGHRIAIGGGQRWWNGLGFHHAQAVDGSWRLTTIPHALPLVVLMLGPALWLRLRHRLLRRLRLGQCLKCGSDIRGPKGRCEVCGEEILPSQLPANGSAAALAK